MINKVILLGNVGKDPDINYIQSDLPLAKFPLATDESYKKKDGNWEKRTEWHNIIAWRNTAKYVENNIKKGMQVYVEGKIQTRKYQDKEGFDKYITQIVADIFRIVNKRDNDSSGSNYSGDSYTQQENNSNQNYPDQNKEPANNDDPFKEEEQSGDDLPF